MRGIAHRRFLDNPPAVQAVVRRVVRQGSGAPLGRRFEFSRSGVELRSRAFRCRRIRASPSVDHVDVVVGIHVQIDALRFFFWGDRELHMHPTDTRALDRKITAEALSSAPKHAVGHMLNVLSVL